MRQNSVSSQVQALREVEGQLLEFAKSRFHDDDDGECSSSRVEIEPFDTKIPRSVVPVRHHECNVHKEDEQENCYRIHGLRMHNAAASRDSPPLVLLHGYMNGASYYYRNLAGLSRHFETVYSLDLLGWGLSSRPTFTLVDDKLTTAEDFFVESLEAWRRKNDIDKIILAGHSMGGYISVAYCERYPEHVDRLILISPAGVTEDAIDKREVRQSMSLGLRLLEALFASLFFPYISVGNIIRTAPSWSEATFLSYVKRRLPVITDPEEQQVVAKYLFLNSSLPGSGEHCLPRFLTPSVGGRNPTEFRIPHLRVKNVSFLYGERDWMDVNGALRVQARCQEAIQGPYTSVFQVSDAGHLLMVDNWQEFNSAMVLAAGLTLNNPQGQLPRKLFCERQPDSVINEMDNSVLSCVQSQAIRV